MGEDWKGGAAESGPDSWLSGSPALICTASRTGRAIHTSTPSQASFQDLTGSWKPLVWGSWKSRELLQSYPTPGTSDNLTGLVAAPSRRPLSDHVCVVCVD